METYRKKQIQGQKKIFTMISWGLVIPVQHTTPWILFILIGKKWWENCKSVRWKRNVDGIFTSKYTYKVLPQQSRNIFDMIVHCVYKLGVGGLNKILGSWLRQIFYSFTFLPHLVNNIKVRYFEKATKFLKRISQKRK